VFRGALPLFHGQRQRRSKVLLVASGIAAIYAVVLLLFGGVEDTEIIFVPVVLMLFALSILTVIALRTG
jgi:fatty acid desaturase